MDEKMKQGIATALGRIPSGMFVLTSRDDERRGGILAKWVQQVCFKPPTVSVAVAKGRPIMALMSESRHFGLCQLRQTDKVILHKFSSLGDVFDDPFLGFEMRTNTVTGVPILANVLSYLECEMTLHVDVDANHDLFVGRVLGGGYASGQPQVCLRENGLGY